MKLNFPKFADLISHSMDNKHEGAYPFNVAPVKRGWKATAQGDNFIVDYDGHTYTFDLDGNNIGDYDGDL